MVALVAAPTAFADAGAEGAVARILAAQEAALGASTDLELERRSAEADAASRRAGAAVLAPYAEWQQEGFDGFDGRLPNALDTLRLGTPVVYPWQLGAARSAVAAADLSLELGSVAAARRTAAQVAGLWVELAALEERAAVADARLARLDAALSLQESRFQLGEVAGAEVLQLDLEHVRATSQREALGAEGGRLRAELGRWCGSAPPAPLVGDLEALAAVPSAPLDLAAVGPLDETLLVSASAAAAAAMAAEAAVAEGAAWGRPELELEWERVPSLEGVEGFEGWGFRVMVPLPLGSAGSRQQTAARAEAERAAAAARAERVDLESRLAAAKAIAAAAERRLSALRPVLERLPAAEHSLAEQFRLGAISYLVYIDGLGRLDDLQLESIEARAELLQARLELALLLDDARPFPLLGLGATTTEN